jgi:hypothetical protein
MLKLLSVISGKNKKFWEEPTPYLLLAVISVSDK